MWQTVDKQLTLFISNLFPHNAFFDSFFSFFSLQGNSFFIWILIILGIIILEEIRYPGIQKTDKKFVVYFLISFTLTAVLVNFVLKPTFHRPRPLPAEKRSLERRANSDESSSKVSLGGPAYSTTCPTDFSFPSSHAATAFAAATILAFFDKKRLWLYWTVAFLISLSRISLGCHYFFDVFIGGIIGYFISKFILLLGREIHRRGVF